MYTSVIIPTRNRSFLLKKAIQSLTVQTYPSENFEVIIVDNGSTDDTRSVVESYQKVLPNLIYAYEPSPGLHVGRHKGLELSRGEILVYADDDIEAFPTWLEGISESFENPEVALVGGNNVPNYESPPPPWIEELWGNTPYGKANGMYSILDFGNEVKEIAPEYVWGCNFSIRKNVLIEVGGFHPDAMPDGLLRYRGDGETAVSNKIRKTQYIAIFNPKASVYHFVSTRRMNLEYIRKRGYIQGISDSYRRIRESGKLSLKSCLKIYHSHIIFSIRKQLNTLLKGDISPYEIYRQGWWNGYKFHMSEVLKDNSMLEWIVQEDYFAENGTIRML